LVSEANYDWGQGLKALARWQHDHPQLEMDIWYYGTDPAVNTLPMRPFKPQELPIHGPEDVLRHLRGRRLAVSTTLVHGNLFAPIMPHLLTVFHARQPVARTTTFLIYDFTDEPDPAYR
jgi:hypothetical protein